MSEKAKAIKDDLVKAFSTGVSYMMPVVVVGGICLALSLVGGEPVAGKGMVVTNPFLLNLGAIGSAGLGMMIPVLAAYISYSIAGKLWADAGFNHRIYGQHAVGRRPCGNRFSRRDAARYSQRLRRQMDKNMESR